MEGSFAYTPGQTLQVTAEMQQHFDENGYIIVK